MALVSKLTTFFEHYGSGAGFALQRVLRTILADETAILELIDSVLKCVREDAEGKIHLDEAQLRSLSGSSQRQIEEVLDILRSDMDTVVTAVADLKDFPDAAQGAVDNALNTEERIQRAADRLREASHKVFPADQTQSGGPVARTQAGAGEGLVTGIPSNPEERMPRTVPVMTDKTLTPEDVNPPKPPPPPPPPPAPPVREYPPVKAVLEVIAGPHAGRRFEFDRHETFLAGRSSKANLQLFEDAYFSRNHFLLEFNPPRCYLRDLGSSNGTLVNDQKVTEHFLRDGDVVSGGKTQIRYSLTLVGTPRTPPPPSLEDMGATHTLGQEPPASAPGFDILGPTTQGALGSARVARRKSDQKVLTLKFVRPNPPAGEETMRNFLRGLAPLMRLDHARLVRQHFATMVEGWLCFLTDHVEETFDLRQRLIGQPEEVLVQLCCATTCYVLEGLAYAHELGIFHGDVQPANVLISNMGGFVVARLADLGLTRSLIDAGLGGMTHKGENARNVHYLAPELITRPRSVDSRTDVYSSAATLYYLLTGHPPHDFTRGKDPVAVILGDAPVPIHHHLPSLPGPLAAVIHRALARDPAERFPSVADLYMALREFTSARPPG